jgi:hypothetical protein
MPKSYGTYKTGAEIYKDTTGLYIVEWDPKKDKEYKKRLKTLKNYITKSKDVPKLRKELARIRRQTRKNRK